MRGREWGMRGVACGPTRSWNAGQREVTLGAILTFYKWVPTGTKARQEAMQG